MNKKRPNQTPPELQDEVPLEVTVQYANRKPWAPSRQTIGLWAYVACQSCRCNSLTVRIVGRPESRRLNRSYRKKDKATNVLSFPDGATRDETGRTLLGDLVVCAPVVAAEAKQQGKTLSAHWAHMIVHGTLHLLGYDHERNADAKRMERHEAKILQSLGYVNPYSIN